MYTQGYKQYFSETGWLVRELTTFLELLSGGGIVENVGYLGLAFSPQPAGSACHMNEKSRPIVEKLLPAHNPL